MTRPISLSCGRSWPKRSWRTKSSMGTCRLWIPVDSTMGTCGCRAGRVQASPVGPVSPRTTMGTCPLIGLNMPLIVSQAGEEAKMEKERNEIRPPGPFSHFPHLFPPPTVCKIMHTKLYTIFTLLLRDLTWRRHPFQFQLLTLGHLQSFHPISGLTLQLKERFH